MWVNKIKLRNFIEKVIDSYHQEVTFTIKTTDGKTIITDGKPQVDEDTGLVSYKNAETGKTEQINRDQVRSMGELDN